MRVTWSACEAGQGVTAHSAVPAGSSRSAARRVEGIVFDVADVLYDATLWRRWLLRLINRLDVHASYAGFFAVWDREYLVDVRCGRREFGEAFQSFLLASGLTWAQIDEIEASSRIQRKNFESNVRPLPGVVKTIARLGELGLPLVAYGDVPYSAARLAERLERLGLGSHFGSVLSSFDIEAAQPSPKCYESALDALGLAAHGVAYVGHDADHLAGAKTAGMQTVAFNFQRPARADYFLTRFEDLPAILELGTGSNPPSLACPDSLRGGPALLFQGEDGR